MRVAGYWLRDSGCAIRVKNTILRPVSLYIYDVIVKSWFQGLSEVTERLRLCSSPAVDPLRPSMNDNVA